MPPKKDAAAGESTALLVGFTDKETKLLAAAFVSCTAPDKYDYDVMSALTGNTAGSLKKMWPPVKKKAVEGYASFAAFLGQAGVAAATPAGGEPKPAAPAKVVRKRKAVDEVPEDAEDGAKDLDPPSATDKSEGDKSDSKKKKAPAAKKEKKAPVQKKEPAVKGKGRPKKAIKKEESASDEETKDESAENSADGGNGLDGEAGDDI